MRCVEGGPCLYHWQYRGWREVGEGEVVKGGEGDHITFPLNSLRAKEKRR